VEAKNYYEILGVPEDASQDAIERLYKRIAKQHHPDRGGDEEDMKAINEAYQVLRNELTRHAYDSRRKRVESIVSLVGPPLYPHLPLFPNTVLGRLISALFPLLGGLLFLFLVKIYYLRFMWPLFLFAILVVLFGVWKVREVMIIARKDLPASHLARRYVWAQELAFWSIIGFGAYTIYVLVMAM
jgi:DnaJ domain